MPPKCGALGGLKMNLTCCLASSDCRVGCKALKESWSSFSPPLKFVPWSDRSPAGFPRREMNLQRAIRNESSSRLLRTSIWTAWMVWDGGLRALIYKLCLSARVEVLVGLGLRSEAYCTSHTLHIIILNMLWQTLLLSLQWETHFGD